MTIVLNTLETDVTSEQLRPLIKAEEMEVVNTSGMKISHCMGCNQCWLKTPGVCVIKDDYEMIIKKLVGAENLWLISNTHFGFINWQGKRVMDRLMPLLNMYIEMRDGWERHQLRYHALNVGLLYTGQGDQQLLGEWCERTAANISGHSLGAFRIEDSVVSNQIKEGEPCM